MNEELMEQIRGAKSEADKKAIIEKAVRDLTENIYKVALENGVNINNLDVINARLHKELKPIADSIKALGPAVEKIEGSHVNILGGVTDDKVAIIAGEIAQKLSKVIEQSLVEGIHITVPKPDVTVSIPPVQIPEIKVPDIIVPAVEIPEIKVPEVNIDLDRVVEALSPLKLITNKAKSPISVKLSDGKEFVRLANLLEKVAKSVKDTNKQVVAYSSGPSEVDISETSRNAIAQEQGYSTIGDGRTTVTNTGTRVQLSLTSVPCKKVVITGEDDNTGVVVVGGATVVAAQATRRGTPLVALQSDVFFVDNLNKLYIDATVSTEGVTYVYYN
jgi:hypothetical protein